MASVSIVQTLEAPAPSISRTADSRLAWRYRALLAAILLGGLILAVAGFTAAWLDEREGVERDFRRAAQRQVGALAEHSQRVLDAVDAVGALFESSSQVTNREFEVFVSDIFRRLPSVRALQWVAYVPAADRARFESRAEGQPGKVEIWERDSSGRRVRAGQRAEYFPVLHIAPADDRAAVLGFDVGYEARRREALARALRAKKPVASRSIRLLLDKERLPATLVVRPVFDSGKRLLGYASTALVYRDLVEGVLGGSDAQGVDLAVYELDGEGHPELLYQRSTGQSPQAPSRSAGFVNRWFVLEHVEILDVAGLQLRIIAHPTAGQYPVTVNRAALGMLLGGLLLTAVLFGYVRSLYRSALLTVRANQALKLRDRAIESSTNAVLIVRASSRHSRIEYVNAAFERITGYSRAEVLGRDWRMLQGGREGREAQEMIGSMLRSRSESEITVRSYRKDGTPFWNSIHVAPVRDDHNDITHYVGILNDVTQTRDYQDQLQHQATHDELTGLPNRALLLDRIEQGIAHAARQGRLMAVMFVDLDHFKRINDGYGHGIGDQVLRALAQRLGSLLRAGDTLARYGGDEFVIVLNDQADEEGVLLFCKRLAHAIAEPLLIGERELLLDCSVGVSLYPRHGSGAASLLQHADSAMYRVKDEGRGSMGFYSEEISSDMHLRLSLEQGLRRALERQEFFLEYQPRVDMGGGQVTGVEALVRWNHPDLGRVPPAHFISLAEDSGLILPIGDWVLETACARAAAWTRETGWPVVMSVNLSPRQFRSRDLVSRVAEILDRAALAPAQLQIELTESSMMQDVAQATRILQALTALGVRLALDDFGTGYSSLAYLKTFPIHDLKIDRSFVRDVANNNNDAQIARSIIVLAHGLGLRVVAEGVETGEQLQFLRENDCDECQGFYFAKPMPEPTLMAWRRNWVPSFPARTESGRVIALRR